MVALRATCTVFTELSMGRVKRRVKMAVSRNSLGLSSISGRPNSAVGLQVFELQLAVTSFKLYHQRPTNRHVRQIRFYPRAEGITVSVLPDIGAQRRHQVVLLIYRSRDSTG